MGKGSAKYQSCYLEDKKNKTKAVIFKTKKKGKPGIICRRTDNFHQQVLEMTQS